MHLCIDSIRNGYNRSCVWYSLFYSPNFESKELSCKLSREFDETVEFPVELVSVLLGVLETCDFDRNRVTAPSKSEIFEVSRINFRGFLNV